jgi:hypothetical protein
MADALDRLEAMISQPTSPRKLLGRLRRAVGI